MLSHLKNNSGLGLLSSVNLSETLSTGRTDQFTSVGSRDTYVSKMFNFGVLVVVAGCFWSYYAKTAFSELQFVDIGHHWKKGWNLCRQLIFRPKEVATC